jgi:hypothetical protein
MEGIFLRIPLGEATLAEARELVEDPSFWEETRLPILYRYAIRPDEYWDLTVSQHAELHHYLVIRGDIDADS